MDFREKMTPSEAMPSVVQSMPTPEAREVHEAVKGLREFTERTMPFLDSQMLTKLPPKELISLLEGYWNTPASFEHFKQLLTGYGKISKDVPLLELSNEDVMQQTFPLHDQFISYLFGKLPLELKERWEGEVYGDDAKQRKDALRRLARSVSKTETGLNLGFHTSTHDFGEVIEGETRVKKEPTNDIFVDENGEQREDSSAKTWYSIDSKHLYKDAGKGVPNFVYLVEVPRGDSRTHRHYAKDKGAFYNHADLVVRHKIPLTSQGKPDAVVRKKIMKELGLEFSEFGKE